MGCIAQSWVHTAQLGSFLWVEYNSYIDNFVQISFSCLFLHHSFSLRPVWQYLRGGKIRTRDHTQPVESPFAGTIFATVFGTIVGPIFRAILGRIFETIFWELFWTIFGTVFGKIFGKYLGNIWGNILRTILNNIWVTEARHRASWVGNPSLAAESEAEQLSQALETAQLRQHGKEK